MYRRTPEGYKAQEALIRVENRCYDGSEDCVEEIRRQRRK